MHNAFAATGNRHPSPSTQRKSTVRTIFYKSTAVLNHRTLLYQNLFTTASSRCKSHAPNSRFPHHFIARIDCLELYPALKTHPPIKRPLAIVAMWASIVMHFSHKLFFPATFHNRILMSYAGLDNLARRKQSLCYAWTTSMAWRSVTAPQLAQHVLQNTQPHRTLHSISTPRTKGNA